MKKVLLFVCLSFLLVLAGCNGRQQVDMTTTSPYLGGSSGIVASFEQIDDEIYLGGGIPILMVLENKGEYDVSANSMALKLQGISRNDFSGIPDPNRILSNPEEIEKISEFNPDGGISSVDFGTAVFRHSEIEGDKYLANIFIEYVFPYQTAITVTNACVKGDPTDESVCNIEGTKQAFSSGAPIQLSGSVVQKRAGRNKILLEIPIRNAGPGEAVVRVGGSGDARFNTDYDEVNIRPSDTDLGWECSAKGRTDRARLAAGETVTVKCSLEDVPANQRTIETFTLISEYYYREIINKQVLIREES